MPGVHRGHLQTSLQSVQCITYTFFPTSWRKWGGHGYHFDASAEFFPVAARRDPGKPCVAQRGVVQCALGRPTAERVWRWRVSGPPPLHRRRLHLVDSVALLARPPICKPRHSARLRERSAITKEKEKPSRPDHAPYLQDNRRPSALRVKSREKSIGIKVRRKVQSDYYRLIMFWVQSGFACPSPASVWGWE